MQFVDEAIEVNVRVGVGGDVRPLAFTWRGQQYPVTGMGRTHTRNDNLYILVMTPGDWIFELRWHMPDNRWFVARAPERFTLV